MLGDVPQFINPGTQTAEAGGSQVRGQPGQHSEALSQTVLKQKSTSLTLRLARANRWSLVNCRSALLRLMQTLVCGPGWPQTGDSPSSDLN